MTNSNNDFFFATAFLDGKWSNNVAITVKNGLIDRLEVDAAAPSDSANVNGIAIPGMINVHSHAFQRAFAGLSEFRTSEHDSFWTWRKLMYECATKWTPDDVHRIATGLYRELRENGYTWVGEFQYLHHDIGGAKYADATSMSDALVRAAQDVGLGICILPVLYQRAGFSGGDLDPAQQRFVTDEDTFLKMIQTLRSTWASTSNVRVGMAFHSLRAVAMDVIVRVTEAARGDDPDIPIHIHVAEQTREVKDCKAAVGKRPVEYLLSEAPVDQRWCLIHATHIESAEISAIAKSGGIAGLCPTTEANLGDGIFPASEFLKANGKIAVGSDSHVCIHPRSELRLLEYGQRLTTRKRAILGTETQSVGRRLYEAAAIGGSQALSINAGRLAVGHRADIVVLDPNHPTIQQADDDRIFDRYVFCDAGNPVAQTIVGGIA